MASGVCERASPGPGTVLGHSPLSAGGVGRQSETWKSAFSPLHLLSSPLLRECWGVGEGAVRGLVIPLEAHYRSPGSLLGPTGEKSISIPDCHASRRSTQPGRLPGTVSSAWASRRDTARMGFQCECGT
ncbi:unnamed protein product [Pleuronectes platessa]|uniref:Uncharacterized protein n=1 Tax=Pleuronectes platessa TaxID=8262 RepID=A0A9N7YZJ1_PLEPL|nr:unnamed protein product [Pleuronectes platessa]